MNFHIFQFLAKKVVMDINKPVTIRIEGRKFDYNSQLDTVKNFKIRKDIIDKNPGADKEMFPNSMVSSTINSYLQQTVPFNFGILLL